MSVSDSEQNNKEPIRTIESLQGEYEKCCKVVTEVIRMERENVEEAIRLKSEAGKILENAKKKQLNKYIR
jgi:hypothetical protein